eukprot:6209127-Alexandrium_andersonii.AAC.1
MLCARYGNARTSAHNVSMLGQGLNCNRINCQRSSSSTVCRQPSVSPSGKAVSGGGEPSTLAAGWTEPPSGVVQWLSRTLGCEP